MGAIFTIAIVLFVAGGFIAYFGDRLGTRIGKKRLTSFGLRPRHTAMLWTVCSGGGIALATLIVLLAYDSTVKTALLQGPQIIANNYSLKKENRALLQRNAAADAQARTAEAQSVAAQAQGLAAQRSLRAAQSELSGKRLALKQEQEQLRAAEGQLESARKSLTTTQTNLHEAQGRVLGAKQQLQLAQASVRQSQQAALKAEKVVLRLSVQGDALAARNANLTAQNKQLAQYTKQLTGLVQQANTESLIYPHGQELGRRAFPTNQPIEAIRAALVSWLDTLSQAAKSAGAGLGKNGRAVVVATPQGVTEEESLETYARNIAKEAASVPGVVVVADVELNTFDGDQAVISLHAFKNVLVFSRGDVIATTSINGAQSEDAILRSLQAFLLKRVRPDAQRQGIIPILDPQTGEVSVGEPIASDTALALARQIQQIGGPAHVIAAAAQDTYSSGPLRLKLSVAPPPAAKPL